MIEKACMENQILEARCAEMGEKIERGEGFTREIVKMVQDNNEEIIRTQLVILNFKKYRCEADIDELG